MSTIFTPQKSKVRQRLWILPKSSKTPDLPASTTSHTRFNATYTMSLPSCTNEETEEELKSWHDWIGSRVSISGTKVGILRYFGKAHFAEGSWCGVELDEPVGKNNGTVKDVRYFTCKANFGIFAPLSKTEKLLDETHKAAVPIAHKSKLPQSKSRLKFIPLQSEIPKSLSETIFLQDAKSHLPYYQSNANEPKTNIVNEIYQKHCKSEDFLEKGEPNHFNNNNNTSPFLELGHLKIAERRTSTPLANPFRKHSTERRTNFLNKTITLDYNRRNSYSNQESLGFLQDNSLLNATFDLLNTPVLDNAITDKKEKTFIHKNTNIFPTDFTKRLSDGCIDYEEEPKSSELEESLGILSPSQMKDFTLSFDNNVGIAFQMSPKIRKIESCDDVNEIPEFEDNRTYQESSDAVVNFDPQNPLKPNPITSTQIFDPVSDIGTQKSNTGNSSKQGGNAGVVTECLNMQSIKNITPKSLNKLNENFSFSDFCPVEDATLNALPSATSTPTLNSLKLSKLSSVKPTRSNLIFSDVDSSSIGQNNFSSTLNQTFNYSHKNNPSTSKVNVISKLLNDLDQAEEISVINTNNSKFESSEYKLFVASQNILSDLNQKTNSSAPEETVPCANLAIFGTEKKQLIPSQTAVCTNSILSDDKESHKVVPKLNNRDSLEENKVISFYPDINTPSLLNHIFGADQTANIASKMFPHCDKSEDGNKCDKSWNMNITESNHMQSACQNTIDLLLPVTRNSDYGLDAVTVNSKNKTQLDLNVILNTEDKNENLVNANTFTILSQIPIDVHPECENMETGNLDFYQADETKSSDCSVFIEDNNICFDMVQEEKCDLKLESVSANRLSETFSCCTVKELNELENEGILLNNECMDQYLPDTTAKSDVIMLSSNSSSLILKENEETHVLDVTMTVMKADNLNMTINIDSNERNCEPEQTSGVTRDESDSLRSKQSPILQNVLSNESQFSNDIKSNDGKNFLSKQPKKNVISKIKLMLENDKNSCADNQENQKLKHNVTKKMGKWDSVTSKIAAGLADSKKKVKKEVTSRVNTNLNTSRQPMPKILQPQSITKYSLKSNVNRKSEVGNKVIVSNNPKNSLNNQTVCEESNSMCSAHKVNREKDLRVLAQLQNVDCDNKQSKDLKANQKKKRMGLLSKTTDVLSRSNSISSSCSQTSFSASKIVLQPKNSTPMQTKRINENKMDSVTSKINIGSNEKSVPGKSGIGKILPRRNNTLPKVKQYLRPKFQRQ